MQNYLDLLKNILENGTQKTDRTGTGTLSIFGTQLRFDLSESFPLVTTKRVHLKSVIHELLWMVNGETNIRYLNAHGVTIWDEWADKEGELGPVYGAQWRDFRGPNGIRVDQLAIAVHQLKTQPDSRRIVVTAWNPAELADQKLPPCHLLYQFGVADGKLSCHMNMRSVDTFLGLPFNIASYALLTQMVAQVVGLELGELIVSMADTHLYLNHVDQAALQISREPRPGPRMVLNPFIEKLDDFVYRDFELIGYDPHPTIKAPISV